MIENNSTASRPLNQPIQGRLNFFQKTMLDWNELHPYNAVHVVRIPARPDLARLANILNETLEFHGLTHLTFDRKKGRFQFAGGPAQCEIKTIAAADDAQESLRAEIERQVNTGFESHGSFLPFRFFVVPEKESFFLGLVYFHAIADAVAIVNLLKEIFHACLGDGPSRRVERFDIHQGNFRFNPLTLAKKLAAFPSATRQIRQSHKVPFEDEQDCRNRFECCSLAPEILHALTDTAKAWDVTLNDLFLALLMKCCAPYAEDRVREPRRRRIAIGSIVNTRADLGLANPRAFGLFLGSFTVSHEVPDGLSLRDLVTDIRRQTLAIKQRKQYVGTSAEMFLGRFALSFFSTGRRKKLYQKNYPLWGGITNMNLNSLWRPPPGEAPRDYFRGVSTGPLTPCVISVTTVGDVVNVGMTFRSTVFSTPDITQIKTDFLGMLSDLKGQP